MPDATEEVYFSDELGNQFAHAQHYSCTQIAVWEAEGTIEAAKKPTPTRRNPDKYKTVWHWRGIREWSARDLSASMPESVTILIAEGSSYCKTLREFWRGIRLQTA